MTGNEAIKVLEKDMVRRDYSPKTIIIYTDWIKKIAEFYPKKLVDDFTQKDIEEYIKHLVKRLNTAPSSINQAFHSFRYLFNKLWSKNIDFDSIDKPARKRSNPDIFTPEEIIDIIENTNNLQHKLLIALAYSTGLDLSESKNLKISDIDITRNLIKVRDRKGKVIREAIFSSYAKNIYKIHIKKNNPKTYVFESSVTGNRYGDSTVRKILENQTKKRGIKKKTTFKTLKYSHIMHLNQLGRPLLYILSDLKMISAQSLVFFSKIASRKIPNNSFSPLDRISLHKQLEHPINREYFEQIILVIKNKDEAEYLKEALTCLTAGSLRAGIIFAWNAAIVNLRSKCMTHGLVTLNKALKKHYPKAREIKKLEDFSYIKDSLLLLALQELGEIDKSEKDSLDDCLDTRNKCGHPGKYRPKSLKASSFIEELVNIVFI